MAALRILQINLQHSKAALSERINKENVDLVLIQEPWFHKSRVMGLGGVKGKLIYNSSIENLRTCNFCSRQNEMLAFTGIMFQGCHLGKNKLACGSCQRWPNCELCLSFVWPKWNITNKGAWTTGGIRHGEAATPSYRLRLKRSPCYLGQRGHQC
jgi:hypothetical protein